MNRGAVCGCVPAALGAFDFGLLALAGPRVARDVGAVGAVYPWLFGASAFAYGAAVLPAAVATSRYGPPRALAAGLALSAAGTAGLAVAPGLAPALAARVVFGLGGALAATAALALLAALPSAAARRAAFAALGGAVGAGFACGTLLAAVPSWRALFLVLAALCALAAIVARRIPLRTGPARRRSLPGAAPLAGAVVLTGLASAGERGPVIAAGVAMAIALALVGVRRAAPWLPPRGSGLAGLCLAGAATTAGGVGATIITGAELAASNRSAALLGVFGLAVVPGAWLARKIASRGGHAQATAAGLALQAVGLCGVAAALAWSVGVPAFAGAVVVFGLGHVAASGGAAGAVSALAGPVAPALGSLLVAAQYVGGGVGTMALSAVASEGGAPVAVLVAAAIAVVGAAAARRAVAAATRSDTRPSACAGADLAVVGHLGGGSADETSAVRTASRVIE